MTRNTDQTAFGFDDVTEFVENHPGNRWFACNYCGIYQASEPRCNKCEEFTEEIEKKNL